MEIVTTSPGRWPLHEVILSDHTLAHHTSCRGLLRAQNDSVPDCIDYGRELSGIEGPSIDQVELGVRGALATAVLGLCGR